MAGVDVLGVRVEDLSAAELCARLADLVRRGERCVVANANVHALNLAWKLEWFRRFLNQSALVFCDGYGVVVAARLLGNRLRNRTTYADLMGSLAAMARAHGFTLFFLGAPPGIAERAAQRLRARCPGVRIAGARHGYFDKTPGSRENEQVIAAINSCRPDILIVGFGMPLQERWLADNLARLDARVVMPAGAVFDYLSGSVRRPPRWMTQSGLEWLGRLLIEPRRLWRRYLIGNPLFLFRVLRSRLGRGGGGRCA